MKNLRLTFTLILGLLLVLAVPEVFAQFPGGSPPSAPPKVPVDGGLLWLLAAGGAFGIKKLRDARLKNR